MVMKLQRERERGCEKCTESEALQIICKKNVILGKCRWYPHTTRGDRIRQKCHDGTKESKTKQQDMNEAEI
jgi:hypothetical protein